MAYYELERSRSEAAFRRRMRRIDDSEMAQWLAVEPPEWVFEHGPALREAGLSPSDAADLHRRLGASTAAKLSALIDAGRMADIDTRYVHLWAASGLLQPDPTRGKTAQFTRWVNEARKYIVACDGDQHLAALAAAAGLDITETRSMQVKGELEVGALETLAALREALGTQGIQG